MTVQCDDAEDMMACLEEGLSNRKVCEAVGQHRRVRRAAAPVFWGPLGMGHPPGQWRRDQTTADEPPPPLGPLLLLLLRSLHCALLSLCACWGASYVTLQFACPSDWWVASRLIS